MLPVLKNGVGLNSHLGVIDYSPPPSYSPYSSNYPYSRFPSYNLYSPFNPYQSNLQSVLLGFGGIGGGFGSGYSGMSGLIMGIGGLGDDHVPLRVFGDSSTSFLIN